MERENVDLENARVQALGRRFRETFLELGGGVDPNEVYGRFVGGAGVDGHNDGISIGRQKVYEIVQMPEAFVR